MAPCTFTTWRRYATNHTTHTYQHLPTLNHPPPIPFPAYHHHHDPQNFQGGWALVSEQLPYAVGAARSILLDRQLDPEGTKVSQPAQPARDA